MSNLFRVKNFNFNWDLMSDWRYDDNVCGFKFKFRTISLMPLHVTSRIDLNVTFASRGRVLFCHSYMPVNIFSYFTMKIQRRSSFLSSQKIQFRNSLKVSPGERLPQKGWFEGYHTMSLFKSRISSSRQQILKPKWVQIYFHG